MKTAQDTWRVHLVVQVGEDSPVPFRTCVQAGTFMEAWGRALQALISHASRKGWGAYRVVSYGEFRKITTESED